MGWRWHKHIPEMMRYAGLDRAPIFMPSVGPSIPHAGASAASRIELNRAVTAGDIRDIYAAQFEGSPFIRMGDHRPAIPGGGDMLDAALAGRDHMEIFVFANDDEGQFWLTARLDPARARRRRRT